MLPGRFTLGVGTGENLIAAFLPEIARGEAMGRVSGWGWSLGYLGGIVSLGCLIRGATPHFEYIAAAASQGIMEASQATGVPIAFGLLTTLTDDQAVARSGDGPDNKGREAALAARLLVIERPAN